MSESEPVVVVGGDAAGMSAASKLKRDAPETEVVVFERGRWVSYAACGLPYYVKGDVPDVRDLVSVTPEQFREERDVDVRLGHEVVGLDADARTVTVETADETFEQGYDSLVVGTGASAVRPPFDGMDATGVFTLHDVDEARALRAYVEGSVPDDSADGAATTDALRRYADRERPETAAVVGGGYVGVEMAEAFAGRGLDVHLFEMLPRVLEPFGETVADRVESELERQGVHLHLDTTVEAFRDEESLEAVVTAEEETPADVAVVGVGVEPNVDVAEAAGIELGPTGAIAVDEYGRTSAEDVYAAGDCAEAEHVVTGEPAYVPLALTANRAGRAIGSTLAGDPEPVGRTAGTAAVKAFDLEAARTGILDEGEARDAGFDPVSATIDSTTRSEYYPGTKDISVTLVADRDSGRVVGGAAVGGEDVPKRVDTVATALSAGMSVAEVERLDLSYAPPFGPAWDPVLTAAKVLRSRVEDGE